MIRKDIYTGIRRFVVVVLLLLAGCQTVEQKQDTRRLDRFKKLYAGGAASLKNGKLERALLFFDKAVQTAGYTPESEAALFEAARVAARLNCDKKFASYRARLADWFPDSRRLVLLDDLHWQMLLRMQKPTDAVPVLRKVLAGNRFSGVQVDRRWYRLGECYRQTFQPSQAAEAWLQVIRAARQSKWNAHSLYRLAEYYFEKKNRELALHYINTVVRKYRNLPLLSRAKTLRRSIRWRFITKQQGLADNSVSAIVFDGDELWIGTWLGGITRFQRSTGVQTLFRAAGSALVSDLIRDIAVSERQVWVATFEGLSRYDKQVDRWSTVYSVAGLAYQRIKRVVLDDGKLWVATIAHGLSVLDLKSGKWRTFKTRNGLPGNNVVALCATPASVWVGTVSGGLGRYDKKSGKWTVYRKQLPVPSVKAVAFDGRRIWIGTHGGGLLSCLENGTDWQRFTAADSGLTSNYVFTVTVAPSGKIWLGTLEGGAAVYDDTSGKWERFTVADGLPGNDITTIAFEGRYVWFGTLNGGVAVLLRDKP